MTVFPSGISNEDKTGFDTSTVRFAPTVSSSNGSTQPLSSKAGLFLPNTHYHSSNGDNTAPTNGQFPWLSSVFADAASSTHPFAPTGGSRSSTAGVHQSARIRKRDPSLRTSASKSGISGIPRKDDSSALTGEINRTLFTLLRGDAEEDKPRLQARLNDLLASHGYSLLTEQQVSADDEGAQTDVVEQLKSQVGSLTKQNSLLESEVRGAIKSLFDEAATKATLRASLQEARAALQASATNTATVGFNNWLKSRQEANASFARNSVFPTTGHNKSQSFWAPAPGIGSLPTVTTGLMHGPR